MKEKANYGNWVPEKALYMLFGAAVILGVIAVIAQAGFHKPVIAVIVGVIGFGTCRGCLYADLP